MLTKDWYPNDASFSFSSENIRKSTRRDTDYIIEWWNSEKKDKRKRQWRFKSRVNYRINTETPSWVIFQTLNKEISEWKTFDFRMFKYYLYLISEKTDLDNYKEELDIFFEKGKYNIQKFNEKLNSFEMINFFKDLESLESYVSKDVHDTLLDFLIKNTIEILSASHVEYYLNFFLKNSPEMVNEKFIRFISRNIFQFDKIESGSYLNLLRYLWENRNVFKISFINEAIELNRTNKLITDSRTFCSAVLLLSRVKSEDISSRTLNWIFRILENFKKINAGDALKFLLWVNEVKLSRIPDKILEIILKNLSENISQIDEKNIIRMFLLSRKFENLKSNQDFLKIFFKAVENNHDSISYLTARSILNYIKNLPKTKVPRGIEIKLLKRIEETKENTK